MHVAPPGILCLQQILSELGSHRVDGIGITVNSMRKIDITRRRIESDDWNEWKQTLKQYEYEVLTR